MSKRDYYEVLEVERDASEQQIKSAYRKLALKFHPDRNQGDPAAEEQFKEAAEAYSILADREKRSLYDRFGHAGVTGAGAGGGFNPDVFAGFEDIFGNLGDLFGLGDVFGGRRRARGGPQRGSDLRYDLEVSFEESFSGTETSIQIPREETCETCKGSGAAAGQHAGSLQQCRGSGQLRFQQGFLTVARPCPAAAAPARSSASPARPVAAPDALAASARSPRRFPPVSLPGSACAIYGEGEHGTAGGPPGDLYVVVHVQEHAFFHREGDDLFCELPVSLSDAGAGRRGDGPAASDGEDRLKIPAGRKPGSRFRLRGKGMPSVSGRGARRSVRDRHASPCRRS